MAGSYRQLGLAPEASMREIEAAYWRFARELKGQSAMGPYNDAYEALTSRARPRRLDAPATPIVPQETAPEAVTPAARPPSKFGWPAR